MSLLQNGNNINNNSNVNIKNVSVESLGRVTLKDKDNPIVKYEKNLYTLHNEDTQNRFLLLVGSIGTCSSNSCSHIEKRMLT